MRHVMIVLGECVPGTDDQFIKWYSDTHLPDVLLVPGFVSAQAFKLTSLDPPQEDAAPTYLAVYEIEGDVQAAVQELNRTRAYREARGTSTVDRTTSHRWLYTAVTDPQV